MSVIIKSDRKTDDNDEDNNSDDDTEQKCILEHTLQRDRNENNTGGQ